MESIFLRELSRLAPLMGLYVILCSFIYISVFWFRFNVQPFSYIGLDDVVSHAGSFLTISAVLLVAFGTMDALIGFLERSSETLTHRSAKYKFTIVVSMALFVAAIYFSRQWDGLQALAGVFLCRIIYFLNRTESVIQVLNHAVLRIASISILVSLPAYAIAFGYFDSNHIIDRKGVLIMAKTDTKLCLDECILVGKLADYFAIIDRKDRFLLVNSDLMKSMEIYSKVHKIPDGDKVK